MKFWLTVEYVALFFGAVLVYDLLARGTSPIPVLLVLGGAAVFYLLRNKNFDALYGMLVFTVGLGQFFFHGAAAR